MTIEKKALYISYFWEYADSNMIWDISTVGTKTIANYILYKWKQFYDSNRKIKLNINNKLLKSTLNLHC